MHAMSEPVGMEVRVRLRPWLESRLNDAWIPGLRWIDKEKGIFRIPWKHHSKHTWTEDDALIFKDWAVVTGRFREGCDTPDWPMWKTRLRCALNKAPDIQEVKQKHNLHCDEPYKVYRFVSKTESLWRANATRNASMVFDGVPYSSTIITSSPNPFSNNTRKTKPSHNYFYRPSSTNRPASLVSSGDDVSGRFPQTMSLQTSRYGESTDDLYGYPDNYGGFNSINEPSTSYYGSNSSYSSSVQVRCPSNSYSLTSNSRRSSLNVLPDVMEPDTHQLCVRIQHLTIKVKDNIITNPNGCCIFYGRYEEEHDSPSSPDPIEPPITNYVSEKNKPYVDLLLDNMKRGIVISATQGSIYAERVCKCAVFVYAPTSDGEYQFLLKLSRREREKIFDFDTFVEQLESFRDNRGLKPHFEVILAFGQQIKPGITTDNLLVWCRVASCKAWFMLQRCHASLGNGAVPNVTGNTYLTPGAVLGGGSGHIITSAGHVGHIQLGNQQAPTLREGYTFSQTPHQGYTISSHGGVVTDYSEHGIKLEPTEMSIVPGAGVGQEVGSEEVIEEAVMEMPLNDDEDPNVIYYPVHQPMGTAVGAGGHHGIVLQNISDEMVEEVVGRSGQHGEVDELDGEIVETEVVDETDVHHHVMRAAMKDHTDEDGIDEDDLDDDEL